MNEKVIRVITAGCSRFREPILLNLEMCDKYEYKYTVFDLGNLNITDTKEHVVESEEFKRKGRYHRVPGVGYAAKSLHKGAIIAQALEEKPEDFCVYMDGDAVFKQPIDELVNLIGDADVGVTIRDAEDMHRSLAKRNEWRNFLGCINAGIIVFNNTPAAKTFVEEWSNRIESAGSDQRALNELVNPDFKTLKVGDVIETPFGRVKCLDGSVYNYGYWPRIPDKNVKIIHCKGLRFHGTMDILTSICRNSPVRPLRGFERDFVEVIDSIGWEPHSISNIEAYYWWALIARYRPEVVIESGVCRGRSTHVIAEACKKYKIPYHIALEKSREHEEYIRTKFQDYGTEFIYGQDSAKALTGILDKVKKHRCLLIVDGPKNYDASMELYKVCSGLHIVAIGVHDCNPAGGCEKALKAARNKYWGRGLCYFTEPDVNTDLLEFNTTILGALAEAYKKSQDSWEKKIGREMSFEDYLGFIGTVGIVEVEGK